MRNLTPAKVNRRFHLVSVVENSHGVVLLKIVVVLVGARSELYLLDGDKSLFGFCLFLFLLLLVLKLAEVDDPADRGLSLWRNFNQVQSLAPSNLDRLLRRHNSELGAVLIDHTHFADAYALVDSNRRSTVSSVSESSSLKAADSLSSWTSRTAVIANQPSPPEAYLARLDIAVSNS